ncbi:MAG: hypothetical protein AAF551_14880 [Bacteroidota bacterium]
MNDNLFTYGKFHTMFLDLDYFKVIYGGWFKFLKKLLPLFLLIYSPFWVIRYFFLIGTVLEFPVMFAGAICSYIIVVKYRLNPYEKKVGEKLDIERQRDLMQPLVYWPYLMNEMAIRIKEAALTVDQIKMLIDMAKDKSNRVTSNLRAMDFKTIIPLTHLFIAAILAWLFQEFGGQKEPLEAIKMLFVGYLLFVLMVFSFSQVFNHFKEDRIQSKKSKHDRFAYLLQEILLNSEEEKNVMKD